MPADSFTGNLNLRKPEVGAAFDTWGGTAGLNSDMDLIDAVFLATGLGTPVGLHVGATQVLNVEGTVLFADSADTTKAMTLDSSLITTGTLRTLSAPDESGIIATQAYAHQWMPTGTVLTGYYPFAPPGFVMADGRTIGDATSGATNLADPKAQNLYLQLWLITTNTQCPVSGGRGASAAADWAAHKTLALPNHSGRTMAGRDDLSGTAAGIWPGATVLAAAAGEYAHTLSVAELAAHSHSDTGHSHGISGNYLNSNSVGSPIGAFPFGAGVNISQASVTNGSNAVISNAGSSAAHNNMQPTIVVDVIIAL